MNKTDRMIVTILLCCAAVVAGFIAIVLLPLFSVAP
jgi:hypothetical protein